MFAHCRTTVNDVCLGQLICSGIASTQTTGFVIVGFIFDFSMIPNANYYEILLILKFVQEEIL